MTEGKGIVRLRPPRGKGLGKYEGMRETLWKREWAVKGMRENKRARTWVSPRTWIGERERGLRNRHGRGHGHGYGYGYGRLQGYYEWGHG